jgi:hypothetical protein
MPKLKKVKLGKRFENCPSCGYRGGFHVFFEPLDLPMVRMNLKCPGCRARYDLGLVVGMPGRMRRKGRKR